jgi:hypothetical protein
MSLSRTDHNNVNNNDRDIDIEISDYKDYFFTDVYQTVSKPENCQFLLPLFDVRNLEPCFEHILQVAFDVDDIQVIDIFCNDDNNTISTTTTTPMSSSTRSQISVTVINSMLARNLLYLPTISQSQIDQNENYFQAIKNGKAEDTYLHPIQTMFYFLFEEFNTYGEKFVFTKEERELRHRIYEKLSKKYLGPKDYIGRVLQIMSYSFQEIKDSYQNYVPMVGAKWLNLATTDRGNSDDHKDYEYSDNKCRSKSTALELLDSKLASTFSNGHLNDIYIDKGDKENKNCDSDSSSDDDDNDKEYVEEYVDKNGNKIKIIQKNDFIRNKLIPLSDRP